MNDPARTSHRRTMLALPSPRPSRTHKPAPAVEIDPVSQVLLGRYQVASALRRRSLRADEVLDYLSLLEDLSEQT